MPNVCWCSSLKLHLDDPQILGPTDLVHRISGPGYGIHCPTIYILKYLFIYVYIYIYVQYYIYLSIVIYIYIYIYVGALACMRRLSKLVTPRVLAATLRIFCDGWCTHSRYQRSRPCRLCGLEDADNLAHIARCPRTWQWFE